MGKLDTTHTLDIARGEMLKERIDRIVCREYNILPEDIKQRTRRKGVVLPKQICMYFMRRFTSLHLKEIGKMYNDMDHSSVLYSQRLIENSREVDQKFNVRCHAMEAKILTISQAYRSENFDEEMVLAVTAINTVLTTMEILTRIELRKDVKKLRKFREVLINSALLLSYRIDFIYDKLNDE